MLLFLLFLLLLTEKPELSGRNFGKKGPQKDAATSTDKKRLSKKMQTSASSSTCRLMDIPVLRR